MNIIFRKITHILNFLSTGKDQDIWKDITLPILTSYESYGQALTEALKFLIPDYNGPAFFYNVLYYAIFILSICSRCCLWAWCLWSWTCYTSNLSKLRYRSGNSTLSNPLRCSLTSPPRFFWKCMFLGPNVKWQFCGLIDARCLYWGKEGRNDTSSKRMYHTAPPKAHPRYFLIGIIHLLDILCTN